MKLYDLFKEAYTPTIFVPWRIYGNKNKLICSDYGNMVDDIFDNLEVKSYMWNKKHTFIKVYVNY